MENTLGIILTALFILGCFLLHKRHRQQQYFKKRGIATPPFDLLFGHLLTMWSAKSSADQLKEWTRKYGKIYGIFAGSSPIYIVSDVNFLEQVFIKQFSSFYSHQTDFSEHAVEKSKRGLLIASGNQWRRQKQIIGPIISTGIKQMSPLFDKCVDEMIHSLESLNSNIQEEFNIYPLYKKTFWNMACGSFGIDVVVEENATNKLFNEFEKFFMTDTKSYPLLRASELFPSFGTIFLYLFEMYNEIGRLFRDIIWPKAWGPIWEGYALYRVKHQLFSLFNKRWRIPHNEHNIQGQKQDFLTMMSATLTFDSIEDENNVAGGQSHQPRPINAHEIIDNAFLFMGAQYAGNAAVMACCSYILATNCDIQNKLVSEINQFASSADQDKLNGDIVSQMPYLDMFIREILRMYPLSTLGIDRQCMRDTIVNGIHVSKGSVVQADVYSIHYDPDIWGPEDPEIFCPERHLTENRHPLALLFFGAGPRMCPGVRLALITAKVVLVRLLQHYNIVACESQEKTLGLEEKVIHLPTESWVKLVPRK
ncbi:hypothetical protein I4U23_015818 [Adineta vaga]|nr:hypothetical protein I4U23_015818 [Adineta vaga]